MLEFVFHIFLVCSNTTLGSEKIFKIYSVARLVKLHCDLTALFMLEKKIESRLKSKKKLAIRQIFYFQFNLLSMTIYTKIK